MFCKKILLEGFQQNVAKSLYAFYLDYRVKLLKEYLSNAERKVYHAKKSALLPTFYQETKGFDNQKIKALEVCCFQELKYYLLEAVKTKHKLKRLMKG